MRQSLCSSQPQLMFKQKGTTLFEVLIAFFILAIGLLGSEIYIFKSLALSREAMLRSEILIEIESLANMLTFYFQEKNATHFFDETNIHMWEEQLKKKIGQGTVKISRDGSSAIIEVFWLANYNSAITQSVTCIVDSYGQHIK